jgi:hypothetical protein
MQQVHRASALAGYPQDGRAAVIVVLAWIGLPAVLAAMVLLFG